MKVSKRIKITNKDIIHPVYNLLDDNDVILPMGDDVALSSTLINKVRISSSETKYTEKPHPTFYGVECRCPHLNSLVYPRNLTLDEFKTSIEEGRLFRHYFDVEEVKKSALDIANRVKSTGEKDKTINKRVRAYQQLSKGRMAANYIGTAAIVNKYGLFQAVFFDIDECNYTNVNSLYHALDLKPNIIYEGFSHGVKNSYHLVYILDSLHSCNDYKTVYDLFAAKISKRGITLDNAAKSPCQIIYGTCNHVYVLERRYYTVNYAPQSYVDNYIPEFPITSDCLKAATKSSKPVRKESAKQAFRRMNEPPKLNISTDLHLPEYFLRELMSVKGTHHFLNFAERDCVEINCQCDLVNQPFVYSDSGLLTIKPFHYINGKKTKFNLKDGRKRQARLLTQLFLTMCPQITPEDLVYNVIRVLNQTCDWSAQMSSDKSKSNTYGNDVLLNQIKESYKNFKSGSPEFSEETINRFRDRRKKRNINTYYFEREELQYKSFYCYWFSEFMNSITYNPVSDQELNRRLKSVFPNSNKGIPRTVSGRMIIELYLKGYRIGQIRKMIKDELGKDVEKKDIRETIKKYKEKVSPLTHSLLHPWGKSPPLTVNRPVQKVLSTDFVNASPSSVSSMFKPCENFIFIKSPW